MKLFFILITISVIINSEGFVAGTVLYTNKGTDVFENCTTDSVAQTEIDTFQSILYAQHNVVEAVIELLVGDEQLVCHPKQLFWCVNKDCWEEAQNLKVTDQLININHTKIIVDKVATINKQTVVYGLTVGPPHYLFVGKQGILAHNFVESFFISTGFTLAFGSGAVEFAATITAGFITFGGFVSALCFKKSKHGGSFNPVSYLQPPQEPVFLNQNDDDKDKQPHGKYEDSEKHGLFKRGKASARPRDGQKALDRSVEVEKSPEQRVAIEDDRIVTLKKTRPGIWHGYVNTWKELEQAGQAASKIRATLVAKKMVTLSGKIIK